MPVVRCRRSHRLPKQSTKFIDSPEHARAKERSTKVIVNAYLYLVSPGFRSTRINLSPFTEDFRGGEQQNESVD